MNFVTSFFGRWFGVPRQSYPLDDQHPFEYWKLRSRDAERKANNALAEAEEVREECLDLVKENELLRKRILEVEAIQDDIYERGRQSGAEDVFRIISNHNPEFGHKARSVFTDATNRLPEKLM